MHSFLFQSLSAEQVDVYKNIMTTILSKVGVFFSYTVMTPQEKLLYGKLYLL